MKKEINLVYLLKDCDKTVEEKIELIEMLVTEDVMDIKEILQILLEELTTYREREIEAIQQEMHLFEVLGH